MKRQKLIIVGALAIYALNPYSEVTVCRNEARVPTVHTYTQKEVLALVSDILDENLKKEMEESKEIHTAIEKVKVKARQIEEPVIEKDMEQGTSVAKIEKQKQEEVKYRNLGSFVATAYDLSVESCGRKMGDKWYGHTANGFNQAGMSREEAMTVAVDPKVIPLGSKLLIEFSEERHKEFNGIYTARDTGRLIKGNKIDIFMGDFQNNKTHDSVWDFGVSRDVSVKLIIEE